MQCFVFFVADHEVHEQTETALSRIGLQKRLSTPDKKMAFQLPYPAYAGVRDGESPDHVRDDVLADLDKANETGFVIVAQGYSCGRA